MTMLIAHITPLEMPVVWIAFAAGAALGAAATWLVLRRHAYSRR